MPSLHLLTKIPILSRHWMCILHLPFRWKKRPQLPSLQSDSLPLRQNARKTPCLPAHHVAALIFPIPSTFIRISANSTTTYPIISCVVFPHLHSRYSCAFTVNRTDGIETGPRRVFQNCANSAIFPFKPYARPSRNLKLSVAYARNSATITRQPYIVYYCLPRLVLANIPLPIPACLLLPV